MPRQSRKVSRTGIHHVMMRGINHQNIFEEQEDYYKFLITLDMMAQSYEPDGTPSGRNYILYAYCLMSQPTPNRAQRSLFDLPRCEEGRA